jgi:CheY-like chemotaxis protein
VVRLPGARVDEQPEGALAAFDPGVSFSRITPSRILIVDDVVWNRDLLRAFLGEGEHELAFATNGEEAIAGVRTFKPDLVLMDLRMPVLDGREATRRIRSELGESAPALIAISASSMSREERDLGALFDGYVRKPIARELLFHALAEQLGTVAEPVAAETLDAPTRADRAQAHSELDAESLHALRMMRDETLPRLQRTLRSAEVRRFAEELIELAGRHCLGGLTYYAERLRGAVERFDVHLMQSLLAQGEEHLSQALDETR